MSFFSKLGDIVTGGLGSLLTGGINALFQRRAEKRQLKNQKAIFDYQFDAQNERQNELFLTQPSMEKQGLQRAGISTAAMNGQFSTPVSAPQPSAASPVPAGNQAEPLSNIIAAMSQAKLNSAQEKLLNVEADNKQREYDDRHNESLINQSNAKLLGPKLTAEVKEISARIQNYEVQNDVATRKLALEADIAYQKLPVELQHMAAQIAELESKKQLNHAEAKATMKSLEVMAANIHLMTSQAGLTNQQAINANLQMMGLSLESRKAASALRVLENYGIDEATSKEIALNWKKLQAEGRTSVWNTSFDADEGLRFLNKQLSNGWHKLWDNSILNPSTW